MRRKHIYIYLFIYLFIFYVDYIYNQHIKFANVSVGSNR